MRRKGQARIPADLLNPDIADWWPETTDPADPYGCYLAYMAWLSHVRSWAAEQGVAVGPLELERAPRLQDWVTLHRERFPEGHTFEPDNPHGAVLIGPQTFPEFTLGWGLLDWSTTRLLQPDGDGAGAPLVFTREQANYLLNYYAVDERGAFVHPNAVFRRLKGHGKDPMIAAQSCMEFCGPARFDRFGSDGLPIGKPVSQPWVVIAAVTREQTRSVMRLFPGMMSPQMVDEYGLDIRQEIIHKGGGGQIEAVTSSYRAAEGIRGTWSAVNESHHWVENNGGHAMFRTIVRNAVKTKARYTQFTNSHNPGENSVAEQAWLQYEQVQARQTRDTGSLYDSREAPPDTDMAEEESLRRGLKAAAGDSFWVPVEGYMTEIWDGRTTEAEARRFYLNQIAPEATSWIAPHEWDAVADKTLALQPGEEVTLGFDGSTSNDNTALTACRVSDGAIFTLKVWAPPKDPKKAKEWQVPREDVDSWVRFAFSTYRVSAAYMDVAYWESYIDLWTRDFHRKLRLKATAKAPLSFDMRSRKRDFAMACEAFLDAVLNKEVAHTGDPLLRQHVLNAQRRPYLDYVGIGKEHRMSSRKIDAAVTAVLAYTARQDLLRNKKSGNGKGLVLSW